MEMARLKAEVEEKSHGLAANGQQKRLSSGPARSVRLPRIQLDSADWRATSRKECEAELKTKQFGEMVLRPCLKPPTTTEDWMTLTFMPLDGRFLHYDVRIVPSDAIKASGRAPQRIDDVAFYVRGSSLSSSSSASPRPEDGPYHSLTMVKNMFVKPIVTYVQVVAQHRKFVANQAEVAEILHAEFAGRTELNRVVWRLTFPLGSPRYVIFRFMVQRDRIREFQAEIGAQGYRLNVTDVEDESWIVDVDKLVASFQQLVRKGFQRAQHEARPAR